MTEGVVDQFELIEVDEQDGEKTVLLPSGLDRGLQAVDEVETVWEASERIDDLAFGDIRLRSGDTNSHSVFIADSNSATSGDRMP